MVSRDAAEGPDRRATKRETVRLGRVVVIGGGCYGSWYAQQLTKAIRKGALIASEIVVVDHNPECAVARKLAAGDFVDVPLALVRAQWADYLADWLAQDVSCLTHDAMVPSPLMPQLCLDWLMQRSQARWPNRVVSLVPLPRTPDMPWERSAPDGRHYVSFATWTCPVNCIEPARCPATKGARSWSLPPALREYVAAEPTLRGPVIFHCEHRTYGVGMIDALAIRNADSAIAQWGAEGHVSVLIGTVSHCHGALGVVDVS